MKNKINKKILRLVLFALIYISLVLLCGFLVPRKYLANQGAIITALITIFGVSITLYTFIQGLIQNIKDSLTRSVLSLEQCTKYKQRIDAINKELKGDVIVTLISALLYIMFYLFFTQISNEIWQTILVFIDFAILVAILFAILDLAFTMFKLIDIVAFINNELLKDCSNEDKKDGD